MGDFFSDFRVYLQNLLFLLFLRIGNVEKNFKLVLDKGIQFTTRRFPIFGSLSAMFWTMIYGGLRRNLNANG